MGRVAVVTHTGTRVPTMANHYFRVTMSPGSATRMQTQHTSEEDTGRLATLAHCHTCYSEQRAIG